MNHWPFVLAAYGLTLAALAALLLQSFRAMRRHESEAQKLRQR